MASIRVRPRKDRPPSYVVLWRDPSTRKQESMPFDDVQSARNFQQIIKANGNHLAPTVAILNAVARRSPSIAELLTTHIDGLPSVTDRSRADYRKDADRHIVPYLGAVAIAELTTAKVEAWVKALAATDMADKSIANTHGLLSAAINTAVRAGDCSSNPCRGIRLPRRSDHLAAEMHFLTPDEWARLDAALGEVLGGHYQMMFRTLAGTGMRWGEAAALLVGDLSFHGTPTVRISRAMKRDADMRNYIGTTKTSMSKRTISLPPDLAEGLAEYVKGKRRDDTLFIAPTGAPLHHSNIRLRAWLPAIQAAELPFRPRIHDLRHSHASWLLAAGVDLMTVQRRLGHESIVTTTSVYGHLLPGQQQAAADALAGMFS